MIGMSLANPLDKRGWNRIHPVPRRDSGDGRGSALDGRKRANWLLLAFGSGTTAPCHWCQYPLTWRTVTADRLESGGSYARWNIVPSCMECNQLRDLLQITGLDWRHPMRERVTQVRWHQPMDMPARI